MIGKTGVKFQTTVVALTLVLLISSAGAFQAVNADSDKPIISSGGAFTVYSPLNITYNSSPATLALGFECFMGGYVLQYDIDGKHQGTIPYTVQRSNETHIEYPATGSVDLPALSEGSHSVTVYMSGVRDTTYKAIVYFTVESSEKWPLPTISNLSIEPATNNTTDSSLQFSSNPVGLYGGGILYSPVNVTYHTNRLPLNLSFSLSMGLQASLTYDVDGAWKGAIPLTLVDTNETYIFHPLTGLVELPQLSEGSHRLAITVVASLNGYFGANPPGAPFKPTGTAGNYEARWINAVYFTVDTPGNPIKPALPAITYLSIQNATYNTTELPLNFNINENYTMATYSLDGQRSIPLTKNAVLWNLSYGTHILTLNVTDCAGNSVTSQASFTVVNPAAIQVQQQQHFPTISIIVLLASAVSALAVLTLAIYQKNGLQK